MEHQYVGLGMSGYEFKCNLSLRNLIFVAHSEVCELLCRFFRRDRRVFIESHGLVGLKGLQPL